MVILNHIQDRQYGPPPQANTYVDAIAVANISNTNTVWIWQAIFGTYYST